VIALLNSLSTNLGEGQTRTELTNHRGKRDTLFREELSLSVLQNISPFEAPILSEVSALRLSPSHGQRHTDLVLNYAYQLHTIYGGDVDIIDAAAILHDLGRGNPNISDEDSIKSSVAQASEILKKVGFPPEKVAQVLHAIQDHGMCQAL
jgi:putative nucleotidyltransferase with HDIG domain